MKISTSWIREYTKIPEDSDSLYKLLESFAEQCVDIDYIKEYGTNLKDIKVGEIIKIIKHPNADKLKITEVRLSKNKTVQIVTGANNIYIGMVCPVIEHGGILPNGTTIKSTPLRGVQSEGMLCAEDELLLGEDHSGIMDLGNEYKKYVGESLDKFFYDVIIDIDNKIISNRPDLFSHRGIAREFSAINNSKFNNLKLKGLQDQSKLQKSINIDILDKDFCTRYIGVIVKDIIVDDSPLWIKQKLKKIGLKSINNIVDISNLVLAEIGQPLHIFDLDKIGGENTTILVRKSKEKETITTLDSKERKLTKNNYVIANKEKALGIAGIMGGKYSEIDANTKNILIESATFDPVMIRKSSKSINLRSEASLRYEKGLPQNFAYEGMLYALELIFNLTKGKQYSKIVDIISKNQESTDNINFEFSKIEKVLGIKIAPKEVINILHKLNFKSEIKNNIITILIPKERRDIKESVDIIEEIGRIYGYQKIPLKNPVLETTPIIRNISYEIEREIKKILVSESSWEIKTYSFINENLLKRTLIHDSSLIKIINPYSEEYTHLRNILLPSMLSTVEKNIRNEDTFSLFEIANTYNKSDTELPLEELKLCISAYSKNKKIETFFVIKKYLNDIKTYLNIDEEFEYIKGSENKYAIYNQSAKIYLHKELIGEINNIHPTVRENFNIAGNLTVTEINVEILKKYIKKSFLHKSISKYPIVIEDINITYSEEYTAEEIIKSIKNNYLKEIRIIDIYKGKPLNENQTSLTVRLIFENFEKTFITEEIKESINEIKTNLLNKFENIIFR